MMKRTSNVNLLQRQHVAEDNTDEQEVTCDEQSHGVESSSNLEFGDRLKEAIEFRRNARKRQVRKIRSQETKQIQQEFQTERSQAENRVKHRQEQAQEFGGDISRFDLSTSKPLPIFQARIPLAGVKSEPSGGEAKSWRRNGSLHRGYSNSTMGHRRHRERRGSRFEKVSIKLNRLLESSISMLPQDRAASSTAVSSSQNGHHYSVDGWQQTGRAKSLAGLGKDKQQMINGVGDEDEDGDEEMDVDGGYAWIILAVMFVINASTFGTARAYGLIFDKLARVDEQTRAQAALPFTVMGAIENMAGPLSGCLLARTTSSWRLTVFTGSCLVTLAHLFAALTPVDSSTGQLLSMGLMCGLGLSFVSISFFQVNNAYFVRYRNTAFGVGMTGAAFGTLYISPMCQYALDNYEGTAMCYLMLAVIIAPNVPLSLLLKPKRSPGESANGPRDSVEEVEETSAQLRTISQTVQETQSTAPVSSKTNFFTSAKLVLTQPIFHLIWPTQLLFCWFNFVFGMIMVDFGKDRGLNAQDVAHLIPVWAFGQLIGRLVLSTLVDLKFLSYRAFTIICFGVISLTTYILNNLKFTQTQHQLGLWFPVSTTFITTDTQHHLAIYSLVFVLSMFIALLYILLNGLIVSHVDKPLQPLSIGISSFLGSFFLLPRAYVIGYYRDTIGNYDSMLSMFTLISLCAALTWLIIPTLCKYLKKLHNKIKLSASRQLTRSRRQIFTISAPHSSWKLASCKPQSGAI